MKTSHDCASLREQLYNYRRGELSELDHALFEQALTECEACQRSAGRLIELLELASSADAAPWASARADAARADALFACISAQIDAERGDDGASLVANAPAPRADNAQPPLSVSADALFARVSAQLHDERGAAAAAPRALALSDEDEGDEEAVAGVSSQRARWARALLAIAAVAVIALGAWAATRPMSPTDSSQDSVAYGDPGSGEDAPEASGAPLELDKLAPASASADAIKVFASQDARWRLEGALPAYELHLERGTVLVEFLPKRGETLIVASDQTRVSVIGTVFYVSARREADATREATPTRVGVLTGQVSVSHQGRAQVIALRDGEALEGDRRVALEPQALDHATALVDLDQHRAQLAARAPAQRAQTSAQTRERPPAPARPGARAHSSPADALTLTRERANAALVARDYASAADAYERLLQQLPRQDRERATVRLELARLYMNHLNTPKRAVTHLRDFIALHPQDVAAPAAQRQLCGLLGDAASQEQACD